ncbi:MAG: VWA domain-containing protein [Acidobacteria bacterium]|nr:VWA domain-containing protein [Acidobacteriota bacterium]
MLERSSLILFLMLFAAASASAQSGRRVAPTPKPTPVAQTRDDAPNYSESKPNPPRRSTYADRFPGIGNGTGKPVFTPASEVPVTVEGDDVVTVDTDLITIPVSVFDRNGLYIPGLSKDDFRIFEDGKEQEIAYFGTSDKPFTVILLIDTSPSTEYKIGEIHQAAAAFVDQLKPQDNVMVIEFAGNINVLTDATNDRARIFKAIRKADWGNGTSLYDAVDHSLRKRLSKIEGRKAIVLFTDGVDTTSRKADYDSTLDMAEESEALIFPIYYNTYFQQPRNTGGGIGWPGGMGGTIRNPVGQSAAEYALGKKYLDELAMYTGGRVFRPESTPGGLTRAFEGMAEELRRQYNIGYIPRDEGKPGQRKQIRVRVDRPNLVLRARDSYIVGASAAKPKAEPSK